MNESGKRTVLVVSLTALGLIATVALGLVLVGMQEDVVEVDLTSPSPAAVDQGASPIRFAVAPVLSPERSFGVYHDLCTYLARLVERPVRLVQRKTYSELNELLRHGSVDIAIVCTAAYLHARADGIPLEAVAAPCFQGEAAYYCFTLVRSDSGLDSFEDLRGRSFAFSDPLSLTGHHYPEYKLLLAGENPESFFSRTIFTYSHDGSITAVLDGVVDGAGVDSLIYEFEVRRDPQLRDKVRIIDRSPPLGTQPVVVPRSLEPATREALQKAFLEIHEAPEGRRILDALAIERFVEPTPELYKTAAECVARIRRHLEEGR